MKPTPEQIEAARKAYINKKIEQYQKKPILSESDRMEAMEAALSAAAEVYTEPPTMIEYCEHLNRMLRDRAATIERCAQDLEAAYAECSTLNLLHGAARLRAMKDKP